MTSATWAPIGRPQSCGIVLPCMYGGDVVRMLGVPEHDIQHNARATVYPDGRVRLMVADSAIFREPGWESRSDSPSRRDAMDDEARRADNVARSARRARNRLYDLAWSNPELRWFVTLTLDASVVGDRYDVGVQSKRLRRWLDNQVRRRGLAYIVVPEYHADGAIHWHGLINDALELVASPTIIAPGGGRPYKPRDEVERAHAIAEGSHIVYNVTQWRYGWSTAIELYGSRRAAVAYVAKYITKSARGGHGCIGGRWYWHGGNLAEPVSYTYDLPFEDVPDTAYVHTIPQVGARCKIYDYYPEEGFFVTD